MIYIGEKSADFAYQNVVKVTSFNFSECFPIGSSTEKRSRLSSLGLQLI